MQPESLQQQCLDEQASQKICGLEKHSNLSFACLLGTLTIANVLMMEQGKAGMSLPGAFREQDPVLALCRASCSAVRACFGIRNPLKRHRPLNYFFVAVFSPPGGSVGGFRSVLSMFCKVPGWFRSDVESLSRGRLSAF